jgi:hypothetical protein
VRVQVEEEDNEESGPPFTKRFRILVQRRIRETIRHQECVRPALVAHASASVP